MNWYARSTNLGVFLAVLSLAGSASAQTGTAPPATPKVALLNIQAAIGGTQEGQAALAQLNIQFAPRQTELDNLRKQGEDVAGRLQNGQRTLSDNEKAKLQNQIQVLQRQLERKQEDAQEDYTAAQNEAMAIIYDKMQEIVDRYARENGFSIVLNSAPTANPVVLYGSSQADITQEIVRLYDQAHPVKVTSSDAKPDSKPAPAPKPATAATRPATPATQAK